MTQPAQSRAFVDGNNVMGSRPDGWWRDRAEAARRLVAEIIPLALGDGRVWTIEFDGKEPPAMPQSPKCLTVIHTGHSRHDGTDDRIVEEEEFDMPRLSESEIFESFFQLTRLVAEQG